MESATDGESKDERNQKDTETKVSSMLTKKDVHTCIHACHAIRYQSQYHTILYCIYNRIVCHMYMYIGLHPIPTCF